MKPDYCDQASHQECNHQQQHKPTRFPFSDNHMANLDAVRAFLVRLAVERKRQSKHRVDEREMLLITGAERPRPLG